MYRNILLPTDGSALSRSAIESGIRLAKEIDARVTGLHVIARLATTSALEQSIRGDARSRSRLKALFVEQAHQYLAVIETAARKMRVRCECLCVTGESPYEEILKTAMNKRCDLIYMASHGKGGGSALLLGSETAKVLTHSPIPVLIHRERKPSPIASHAKPVLGRAAPAAKRGAAR